MISRSIRKFATTAYRAAEVASKVDASNQYGVQLARAQGHVNGFVGGMSDVNGMGPFGVNPDQQLATPHSSG